MVDNRKWPKDWPKDARVGHNFLAELMRRYPKSVVINDGKDMFKSFESFFEDDEIKEQS